MSDLQCAARLLVVRNAEAEYESDEASNSGGSLSLAGRKQARDLGDALRGARVSLIYCSPMARAVQTAEIVAAELGVVVRVRESLGGWNPDESRLADELSSIVDLHRGETVLVVTHGGVVAGAVPKLVANLPDDFGTTHPVDHCAIVEVHADADGWVLRSWDGQPV